MEELNNQVESLAAEDDAAASPPNDLPCAVCQQPMFPHSEYLNALECGHVFHDSCIRECWTRCNKFQGWCPMKCKDQVPTIEQLESDEIIISDDAAQPTPSEIPEICI